jgi:hypothetical protein
MTAVQVESSEVAGRSRASGRTALAVAAGTALGAGMLALGAVSDVASGVVGGAAVVTVVGARVLRARAAA